MAEIVAFQDQESLSKLHYNNNKGKSKFNNSLTFNTLNLDDNLDNEGKSIRANELLGNKGEDKNSTTNDNIDIEDNSKGVSCWLCSQQHRLIKSNKFRNKPIEEKKIVKEQRLCWNFLSNRHVLKDCKSQYRCKVSGCNQQHHTLLHGDKTAGTSPNKLATKPPIFSYSLLLFPMGKIQLVQSGF